MPAGRGKIVLMGSGELTATMVEVHKGLLKQLGEAPRAAFLDTPAGFQLNVDQISQKAIGYFRKHIQQPLAVSSFKSREHSSDFDAEKAFRTLRESAYILIGPGSPTYAVEQWRGSPVPEIFTRCVNRGGCLVAASAAALTVGRFTLPVYEIYKVGQKLHWVEGNDILGKFGLDLVVIPHWNNAEGGTHDTRFCFMGEPRFQELVALMTEQVPVFGLDEHTACIMDLAKDEAQIKGIGTVTLRRADREITFQSGDRFSLDILRGEAADAKWHSKTAAAAHPMPQDTDVGQLNFWDQVHLLEASFHKGLALRDARQSTNALLELDRSIWQAQTELESEEFITQARDTLRDLIVLLGTELAAAPTDEAECLRPLVEGLLQMRKNFRAGKQWTEADVIRDLLGHANISVEDDKDGTSWKLNPQADEPAGGASRMINHPPISVLVMVEREDAALSSLLTYLKTWRPIKPSEQSHLPRDLTSYDVVVSFSGNPSNTDIESLTRFVETGAGWLALVHLSENALPSIFGAQAEPAGPSAELRVLFEDFEHPLAVRLPHAVYLNGRYQALTKTADDNETILYADWHYSHNAVLTSRRHGAGRVACTTLQDYGNPHLQRIIYRLLWQLAGRSTDRGDLGVGILGYAPSVGLVHGLGAVKTTGLNLQAVCDTNPKRLNEAHQDFAEARTYDSAEKLVDDPEVDLVVIATPRIATPT